METSNKLGVVEFYSGIGGMHYALLESQIPFEIVAAYDINTVANAVYRHNFPGIPLKQRNIQGLTADELDKLCADLWTMSPPCQPFTRQGKKKDVEDTRTDSFKHLLQILQEMKNPPTAILLENVKGFETSLARDQLVSTLEDRNYGFEEFLLTPLQFGVPNSRSRYYLLARRDVQEQHPLQKSIPGIVVSNPTEILDKYLEENDDCELLLSDRVLGKQSQVLDIVTPESYICCCFTKSYGQYSDGTGSVLFTGNWDELTGAFSKSRLTKSETEKAGILKNLAIRYFSWREIANLMCFPSYFASSLSPRTELFQNVFSESRSVFRDDGTCDDHLSPTFVRVSNSLAMGIPTLSNSISMISCSDYCLNNTQPLSDIPHKCKAFNFHNSGLPMCELFDSNARIGPLNRNVGKQSYHFRKICLQNAHKICINHSFAFDMIDNSRFLGHVIKSVAVSGLEECLEKCLNETTFLCQSVNFGKNTRQCELSDSSRYNSRQDFIVNFKQFDYYENNCFTKETRCPDGGVHFMKTSLNSEVDEFEESHSLEDCLVDCLESEEFLCRSVKYDKLTKECTISDEDSDTNPDFMTLTIGVDLFEPICLPVPYASCTKPYIYEKVPKTFLSSSESILMVLRNVSVEECMLYCLEHDHCQSFDYNPTNDTCFLSPFTRQNESVNLKSSHSMNYYEVACKKIIMLKEENDFQSPELEKRVFDFGGSYCGFRLVAENRQLKPFARNDLSPVVSLDNCQSMCEQWEEFECRSLSYSAKHQVCSLSQLDMDYFTLDSLTIYDPNFYFFDRQSCDELVGDFTTTSQSPRFDNLVIVDPYRSAIRFEPSSSTVKPVTFTTGRVFAPTSSVTQLLPRRLPDVTIGAFDPDKITVSAMCTIHGATVTVSVNERPYTGALYAAERFSYCRQLVDSKTNFSLFLPRPAVNTSCNTLEENLMLSAVVIVSNDRVIPYDVTTKDDLFYQVTCDYSSIPFTDNGEIFIKGGLVIGGPRPQLVNGRNDFHIALKILRDGKAVENVLLGEQLTLKIESKQDPKYMDLIDCNVTRIGGNGPTPEPLKLLEYGCPTMNQVLGSFTRTSSGVEAPLTAFRIDGSAEIQIVCMVEFCLDQCQKHDCTADPSHVRVQREVKNDIQPITFESVDGRLRVYVPGEFGAPDWKDFLADGHGRSQDCVSNIMFYTISGVLGILLIISVVCFGSTFLRKNEKTDSSYVVDRYVL